MTLPPSSPPAPAPGRRPGWLIGLGLAGVLLVVVALASYAGYRAGLAERQTARQATQAADLLMQYNLGLSDMASGRYNLAIDRFQYILSIDPNYPGVADQLARAQSLMNVTPTATTPPLVSGSSPDEILAVAEQYAAGGNWDGVIDQIALLHSVDTGYDPVKVDSLLFTALRNRGVERIQGDAMEAGIFDLKQAEAFGPLDEEAVNYRAWARLYLAAQSYWGVNWEITVQVLQQLYLLAPNFHDTTQKLYDATVAYANQLNAAGDYCGAQAQYAAAQTYFAEAALAEAQATAQMTCLLTPSPLPGETGTPPASEATPTP